MFSTIIVQVKINRKTVPVPDCLSPWMLFSKPLQMSLLFASIKKMNNCPWTCIVCIPFLDVLITCKSSPQEALVYLHLEERWRSQTAMIRLPKWSISPTSAAHLRMTWLDSWPGPSWCSVSVFWCRNNCTRPDGAGGEMAPNSECRLWWSMQNISIWAFLEFPGTRQVWCAVHP